MSARDAILDAIRRSRPAPEAEPELPSFAPPGADLQAAFAEALQQAGGRVEPADRAALPDALRRRYPDAERIATTLGADQLTGLDALQVTPSTPTEDLAGIDLFVCEAALGVAENGAVWLDDEALGHRAALFLAQHLAVLLRPDALVATMHDAYARLDVDATGFGLFVAGPSKTADIEQSLVIGAHGPRSMTLLLG